MRSQRINSKVFIIAEAGVNHNGQISLAKEMVDVSLDAGADAIKFQSFVTEDLVTQDAPKAEYQKINDGAASSQFEMLKRLELSAEGQRELFAYCRQKGIIFLSSPFDEKSVDILNAMGLAVFKIPSSEVTNLPYLRKIGRLKKKVILSSGMATLKEIAGALNVLTQSGTAKKNITILHCHSDYPTDFKDINLKAMNTIKVKFGVDVGFSDHSLGIEIPIAAAALGAKVIEKHFTLDKNMEGPDHKASLSPTEFKAMVQGIRHVELALGSGEKKPSSVELKNKLIMRKGIVAKKSICKGEMFKNDNLAVKRPEQGLSPMLWDRVIGKKAKKDFKANEVIKL